MQPPQIFALVDCNNFYVSVERAFQPWLENKPVVVLSNGDGCIVARSNEVKALKVAMGTPFFKCADLLKQHATHVFSSNYPLYADVSNRVISCLATFAPDLEKYSLDEAFLPLSQLPTSHLTEYALQIKATVKQWTGIPVSVGLAPTKTLAKLASERAKKDSALAGVLNLLDYAELDEWLDSFEVEEVWGIGSRRADVLRQHGIETALQLKLAPDAWIKKHLSISGLRTVWELRGVSCLPLELAPSPKKAIVSSKAFSKPVTDLDELTQAVVTYLSRAAEKLRQQHCVAGLVEVFVQTNRFSANPHYSNSVTLMLPQATAYTPELVRYARLGLQKLYQSGYLYRKAGVLLSAIEPDSGFQRSLFGPDPAQCERQARLSAAVDSLNQRWGRDTVRLASSGLDRKWFMRQVRLSPRYTTRWNEVLTVN